MNKLIFAIAAVGLFVGTFHLMTTSTTSLPPQLELVSADAITQEQVTMRQFKQWKIQNGKFYVTEEEVYRFSVWAQNLKTVIEHNESGKHSYTLAMNHMADLTQEEFVETFLGLQEEEETTSDQVDNFVSGSDPIDWNEAGIVSPVKNQGSCGSCWAFATVGSLEAFQRLKKKGADTFSEQQLVDCSVSYGNNGCNGGDRAAALAYVYDKGIMLDTDYPYTAKDESCSYVRSKVAFNIDGYTGPSSTCDDLYKELSGQPISVGVDASNWHLYQGGVFQNCGKSINHGVLLTGINSRGEWNIKNSWGPSWGNAGYITLASGNTCAVCQRGTFPW